MMKEYLKYLGLLLGIILFLFFIAGLAEIANCKPPQKSKFYDFNDQIIDGEIRKPSGLYTDSREKAKFDRLLKLKKSFLPELFKTPKNKVFK